jgi:hypothetical protein
MSVTTTDKLSKQNLHKRCGILGDIMNVDVDYEILEWSKTSNCPTGALFLELLQRFGGFENFGAVSY